MSDHDPDRPAEPGVGGDDPTVPDAPVPTGPGDDPTAVWPAAATGAGAGTTGTPPPPPPYTPPVPESGGPGGGSRRGLKLGIAALVAVAVLVAVLLATRGDDEGALTANPAGERDATDESDEPTDPGDRRYDDRGDDDLEDFDDLGDVDFDDFEELLADLYTEQLGLPRAKAECLAGRLNEAVTSGALDAEEAFGEVFNFLSDCGISLSEISGG